jgi:hypothetical protein
MLQILPTNIQQPLYSYYIIIFGKKKIGHKSKVVTYCCSINVVKESTNYSYVTKSLPKKQILIKVFI